MQTRQQQIWIAITGAAGATAVAMGAWAAHGLATYVSAEAVATVHLAVQYQLWHALALGMVVLLVARDVGNRLLRVAGWAFSLGIILFCGSLYGLALGGVKAFAWLTPCGGVALIAGWCCLLLYGVTAMHGRE